jgi:hypothetical protein
MIECSQPGARHVLVSASAAMDGGLARAAIEELGLVPLLIQDATEAVRLLCLDPKRFEAIVAGERVGRASGLTFCGVARDAGIRLPMLLITGDDCHWNAARASRLQVTVLWQPVPAWRIAQALLAILPRRLCGASAEGSTGSRNVRARHIRACHIEEWRRPRW